MKKFLHFILAGKGVIIYYAILLAIMISWTSFTSFPPTPLRLAFLGLVLLPAIIDRNSIMPAVLICFWGIAINGYSYSYMPTMSYLYVGILVVLLPFMWRSCKSHVSYTGMELIPILTCFILIRDLIGDLEIQDNVMAFTIIALLPYYIDKWDRKAIDKMGTAFMVMSVVLSYYSFTTQSLFTGEYGSFAGQERSVWADPNYLSVAMGTGALIGVNQTIHFKEANTLNRILGPIAFAITVPAMLSLASRGGMLCLFTGAIIILAFSKVNPVIKTVMILAAVGFMIFLYTNSFFDMLEERINSDDGTGSERTVIWQNRLNAFASSENPLNILFGYSFHGGLKLGWPFEYGSHNDFVAFLAQYGITGLLLFLGFLGLPVINLRGSKEHRVEVYAGTVYLGLASMTLEPFSAGRIMTFMFWFYLTLLPVMANNTRQKNRAMKELMEQFQQTDTYRNKVCDRHISRPNETNGLNDISMRDNDSIGSGRTHKTLLSQTP